MRLDEDAARSRLTAQVHGVLCTLHPTRGRDPQPVVYAVSAGHVGVPIDRVKPKSSTRLQREDNLAADPRGALLVEHWELEDWSRLWWVRAELEHLAHPPTALVDELAEPARPHGRSVRRQALPRILVCRIVGVTGWDAAPE
ncbi:MAG: hypothetical protein R2731_08525 [Nocardioides sp.]